MTSHAIAARNILIMPMYLKGTIDYLKNSAGDPATAAFIEAAPFNGQLGNIVSINIDISNLSDVEQTGELSFVAGTILAGSACSFSGAGEFAFQSLLALCRSDNTGNDTAIARNANTSTFPTPLTFRVPAQGFERLSAQLWIAGALGNSATTGCPQTATFSFGPKLKIKVNEDRGALLASAMFTISPMSSSQTTRTCGARSFTGAHWFGYPPSYDPAPIPINGGRPF